MCTRATKKSSSSSSDSFSFPFFFTSMSRQRPRRTVALSKYKFEDVVVETEVLKLEEEEKKKKKGRKEQSTVEVDQKRKTPEKKRTSKSETPERKEESGKSKKEKDFSQENENEMINEVRREERKEIKKEGDATRKGEPSLPVSENEIKVSSTAKKMVEQISSSTAKDRSFDEEEKEEEKRGESSGESPAAKEAEIINAANFGFSTASGNKIKVSDKAKEKANRLFSGINQIEKVESEAAASSAASAIKENKASSETKVAEADEGEQKGERPSSGATQSKDDEVECFTKPSKLSNEEEKSGEHSVPSLREDEKKEGSEGFSDDSMAPTAFQGFKTGRGKKVEVSEEARKKAERLFSNLPAEGGTMGARKANLGSSKDDDSVAPPDFQGFKTGSGKKVQVSEEAKKKAERLFSSVPAKGGEIGAENKAIIGFSTGRGKQVVVSKEAREKAAQLFSEDDVEMKGKNPGAKRRKVVENRKPASLHKGLSASSASSSSSTSSSTSSSLHSVQRRDLFVTATGKRIKLDDSDNVEVKETSAPPAVSSGASGRKFASLTKVTPKSRYLSSKSASSAPTASYSSTKRQMKTPYRPPRAAPPSSRTPSRASSSTPSLPFPRLIGTPISKTGSINVDHGQRNSSSESPAPSIRSVFSASFFDERRKSGQVQYVFSSSFVPPKSSSSVPPPVAADSSQTASLEKDLRLERANLSLFSSLAKCSQAFFSAFRSRGSFFFSTFSLIGLAAVKEKMEDLGAVFSFPYASDWLRHHFRLLFFSMTIRERQIPALLGKYLTPDRMLYRMMYHYEREIVRAERSALHKITEGDLPPSLHLVLMISDLDPRVRLNGLERDEKLIQVTDGWYTMYAAIDQSLYLAMRKSKTCVGKKIRVWNSSLSSSFSPSHPLESLEAKFFIRFARNATRPTHSSEKLGYQRVPFYGVSLRSLVPNGGSPPLVLLTVLKRSRIMYMTFGSNSFGSSSRTIRDVKEQSKFEQQRQNAREKHLSNLFDQFKRKNDGIANFRDEWDKRMHAELEANPLLRREQESKVFFRLLVVDCSPLAESARQREANAGKVDWAEVLVYGEEEKRKMMSEGRSIILSKVLCDRSTRRTFSMPSSRLSLSLALPLSLSLTFNRSSSFHVPAKLISVTAPSFAPAPPVTSNSELALRFLSTASLSSCSIARVPKSLSDYFCSVLSLSPSFHFLNFTLLSLCSASTKSAPFSFLLSKVNELVRLEEKPAEEGKAEIDSYLSNLLTNGDWDDSKKEWPLARDDLLLPFLANSSIIFPFNLLGAIACLKSVHHLSTSPFPTYLSSFLSFPHHNCIDFYLLYDYSIQASGGIVLLANSSFVDDQVVINGDRKLNFEEDQIVFAQDALVVDFAYYESDFIGCFRVQSLSAFAPASKAGSKEHDDVQLSTRGEKLSEEERRKFSLLSKMQAPAQKESVSRKLKELRMNFDDIIENIRDSRVRRESSEMSGTETMGKVDATMGGETSRSIEEALFGAVGKEDEEKKKKSDALLTLPAISSALKKPFSVPGKAKSTASKVVLTVPTRSVTGHVLSSPSARLRLFLLPQRSVKKRKKLSSSDSSVNLHLSLVSLLDERNAAAGGEKDNPASEHHICSFHSLPELEDKLPGGKKGQVSHSLTLPFDTGEEIIPLLFFSQECFHLLNQLGSPDSIFSKSWHEEEGSEEEEETKQSVERSLTEQRRDSLKNSPAQNAWDALKRCIVISEEERRQFQDPAELKKKCDRCSLCQDQSSQPLFFTRDQWNNFCSFALHSISECKLSVTFEMNPIVNVIAGADQGSLPEEQVFFIAQSVKNNKE